MSSRNNHPFKGKVFRGMPMPNFQPGKKRPNGMSSSDMNQIANLCRALANMDITGGEVVYSDSNIVFKIPTAQTSAGKGGGSALEPMSVVSHELDYLVCTDSHGATQNVAKPYEMRLSRTAETLDGISYTYSDASAANQTRVASWVEGGQAKTETQAITPRYKVGGTVWATTVEGTGVTVGGAELTYLECPQDGHAWASIGSPIIFGSEPLAAGVNAGTITGLALADAPTHVFLQLWGAGLVAWGTGTPTTDGFSFGLSARTPNSSCVLHYMLVFI